MYASKDRIKCVIVTGHFRIEGELHIIAGSRLTDALNSKTKDFFAVTDATVTRLADDQPLYKPGYIAVNRDAIAAIFPVE